MHPATREEDRIAPLNRRPWVQGAHVLYWMQAAQRAHHNLALDYAITQANRLGVPVVACFGLTWHFPRANLRHYHFMLEGLRETRRDLRARGIELVVQVGEPPEVVARLAQEACGVVTDRGYLPIQRQWRAKVADLAPCHVVEVEGEVVVPVGKAYPREAPSAAVLRRRLAALLPRFLVLHPQVDPARSSVGLVDPGVDVEKPGVLSLAQLDTSVPPSPVFRGGRSHGLARLRQFIEQDLEHYEAHRNDPARACTSRLSPYLHFGHICSLEVALEVARSGLPAGAFLEELITRRELACNHAWFNPHCGSYQGIPAWARRSLEAHAKDRREALYDEETLRRGLTHDPIWNAAQHQMVITGHMHGYMRMYWAKRLIQWCASPQQAFELAVRLNDRYELDGRDPNGYAGIAWCFGLHDRPWAERPVWGLVRPMTEGGLRRKFDVEAYIRGVEALRREMSPPPPGP